MERRLELQRLLEEILGSSNVYFQPPPSFRMQYPAIRYEIDDFDIMRADNLSYGVTTGYLVTLIDPNPDSDVIRKLLNLPFCTFDRPYKADNLYHYAFRIFF